MGEFHFDFTKGARRADIVEQLFAQLDDNGEAVKAAAENAGVPDHHHHDLREIEETIDSLPVSDEVKANMHEVYMVLAEAEASVHGNETPYDAHFHEVGNASGIVNALTVCLAVEALAPNRITATPVQTGSGKVEVAHGVMDVPTPATAAIISRGIPTCEDLLDGELCTPTSAAMIFHFVDEYEL